MSRNIRTVTQSTSDGLTAPNLKNADLLYGMCLIAQSLLPGAVQGLEQKSYGCKIYVFISSIGTITLCFHYKSLLFWFWWWYYVLRSAFSCPRILQ